MELRKEYQDIVLDALGSKIPDETEIFTYIAERCQALADKPVAMLSDEEINNLWAFAQETNSWCGRAAIARTLIAAHIAKQLEPPKPKTVKLRMMMHIEECEPYAVSCTNVLPKGAYKWVSDEFDSPPIQE